MWRRERAGAQDGCPRARDGDRRAGDHRFRRSDADHQEAATRRCREFQHRRGTGAPMERGDCEGAGSGRSPGDHGGTEEPHLHGEATRRSTTASARGRSSTTCARTEESAAVQKTMGATRRATRYEALAKAQEELNEAGGGWQKTARGDRAPTAAAAMQTLALGVSPERSRLATGLTETQVRRCGRRWRTTNDRDDRRSRSRRSARSISGSRRTSCERGRGTIDWRFTSEVIGERS